MSDVEPRLTDVSEDDLDELVDLDEFIRETAEARWGPGGVEVYHRRKRLTDALGIPFNEYDAFVAHCHAYAYNTVRPYLLSR